MDILNSGTLIIGTATNNNAPAGYVGEFISSTIAVGGAINLTTGVAANITSITLTAGDWKIAGAIDFHPGATTTTTGLQGGMSLTSATMGAQDSGFALPFAIATTAIDPSEPLAVSRLLLAVTTTVFLVAVGTFAISTLTAYGTISARRMR